MIKKQIPLKMQFHPRISILFAIFTVGFLCWSTAGPNPMPATPTPGVGNFSNSQVPMAKVTQPSGGRNQFEMKNDWASANEYDPDPFAWYQKREARFNQLPREVQARFSQDLKTVFIWIPEAVRGLNKGKEMLIVNDKILLSVCVTTKPNGKRVADSIKYFRPASTNAKTAVGPRYGLTGGYLSFKQIFRLAQDDDVIEIYFHIEKIGPS
jgi:hypothetical protein